MRRMTERERNDFLNRLLAARTANEMTSLIGLKPLRGDVPGFFTWQGVRKTRSRKEMAPAGRTGRRCGSSDGQSAGLITRMSLVRTQPAPP